MTTSERTPTAWPWPPELDAMEAAPGHHTLLFENDAVRVLDAHVEPGETVPVHTHRWPSVLYVLSASDFVRRDPEGNVLLDTRGTATRRGRLSVVGPSTHAPLLGECRSGTDAQHHGRVEAR